MKKYRIIEMESGRFRVQECHLFFFWITTKNIYDNVFEFDSMEEAQRKIDYWLKQENGNKLKKIHG